MQTRPASPTDESPRPGTLGILPLDKLPVIQPDWPQLLADHVASHFADDDARAICEEAARVYAAHPDQEPWSIVEDCAVAFIDEARGERELEAWLDAEGRF